MPISSSIGPSASRFSRRRFLRLSGWSALSALLAACGGIPTATPVAVQQVAAPPKATPTIEPTSEEPTAEGATISRAPAPRDSIFDFTREPNYDGADYDSYGAVTEGSADLDGVLEAAVYAKLQGQQSGAGGWVRSWVNWVHTQPPGTDEDYTVALDFEWLLHPDAYLHPDVTGGGASAVTIIGATITDRDSGETLTLLIERLGFLMVFVPMQWGDWEYQPVSIHLIGGHTYDITAYLKVSASVYSDTGADPLAAHGPPTGGGSGEVEEHAKARIKSMGLMLKDPPWVQVLVNSVWTPTHDTYTLYQRALKQATGNDYFAAGVLLKLSAGGRYEADKSWITLTAPDDAILPPHNCPFQYSIYNQTLRMDLDPCDDHAMRGRDWSFAGVIDPKFLRPVDPFEGDDEMPLLEPTLGIMWDVDLAAIQDLEKAAALSKNPGLASPARFAPPPNVQSPLDFFDLANWCYILPATLFCELTTPVTSGATSHLRQRALPTNIPLKDMELEANSNLAQLLGRTTFLPEGNFRPLAVGLHIPGGTDRPALDPWGLEIQPIERLTFRDPDDRIADEPVIVVTVLEIWNAFLSLAHPLLERQELEWSANPRFIQWLIRLGETAEYYRTRIDNLYYMTRSGLAVKISDLPEYWTTQAEEILSAPLSVDQIESTIPLPAIVFLARHRRARRFVRRLLNLERLRNWYAQVRPSQTHTIDLYGHVGRGTVIAEDRCEAVHKVLFDLVPRPQPWGVAMPPF